MINKECFLKVGYSWGRKNEVAEAEAEVAMDVVAWGEDVPADALARARAADDTKPAQQAMNTQALRMKPRTTANRCPWSPALAY